MNIDIEELSEWERLIHGERASIFAQGEFISRARREAGEASRELLGVLAQIAHCTINALKQKADVAEAFEPGMRDANRPWSWHRAARNAALRTKTPLADIIKEAIDHDYGQRELDNLGRNRSTVGWAGTCPDCNAKVTVRMMQGCQGAVICCPYCTGCAKVERSPAQELPELGRLG